MSREVKPYDTEHKEITNVEEPLARYYNSHPQVSTPIGGISFDNFINDKIAVVSSIRTGITYDFF